MNDTSGQNTSRVQSLLEVINKHKIFTVVAIIALLGTGIGMWASLPQRIATPVVPKHPLVQFPPPVLSYPVLPKTLNQEIAKIRPPWPSMTPAQRNNAGTGFTPYTPDFLNTVSGKTYYSAPICAPKDLKVTLSPLDVPDTLSEQSMGTDVAIKNISPEPCSILDYVQIGSWLGCEWTRPSPCSKSVFASFRGCKVQVPSYFKVPATLSPSALCSIGAKGDIQAWNLPEVMIYSTSGKLVGLWAVVGADYAADTDIYVGPSNGPDAVFLKPGQSFFYQPGFMTVQTGNIFFRKLPGTYIAQAVIPLGYLPTEQTCPPTHDKSPSGRSRLDAWSDVNGESPPSLSTLPFSLAMTVIRPKNKQPPSEPSTLPCGAPLPGANYDVEQTPPFKVYFYYTKPITFTVK